MALLFISVLGSCPTFTDSWLPFSPLLWHLWHVCWGAAITSYFFSALLIHSLPWRNLFLINKVMQLQSSFKTFPSPQKFFLNQFFIFFAISACTQPQISTDLMIFSCTIYLPLWCSLSSSNHSEVGLLVLLIVRVVYVVLMQVFHQESDLQVFSSRPYLIFSFYEWFFFFFFNFMGGCFWNSKVFHFNEVHFTYHAFDVISLPNPKTFLWGFLLVVLALAFRFMVHFE